MKRAFALALSLFFIASFGFSQKFALKLGSGWNGISAGDFAAGLKGQTDYLSAAYSGLTGEFLSPHAGLNFQGEILYYLRSDMGIGFGFGYSRISKDSEVDYESSTESNSISIKERLSPGFTVMPISINFHYFRPLSPKFTLDFSAGPSLYIANLDWNDTVDLSMRLPNDTTQVFSGTDQFIFKSAGRLGFGVQIGVGIEYALSPGIAAVFSIVGRLASVGGFTGDWTEQGSGDFWNFSDNGTNSTAWYYDWNVNQKTYGQLAFQDDMPSGTMVSNARSAKLGLSGFAVSIGVKIGIGS
jgi:hypothetical protein